MTRNKTLHIIALSLWIILLGFFFAMVEIQIEGGNGWAASLPTWRIEKHWLLNIFWGGRPMTGYHAWVFSFMFLIFSFPMFLTGQFSLKLFARVLGSLMLFWIIEDFLWFILNPAFGIKLFNPQHIPWHVHWFLGVPTDYIRFTIAGAVLMGWSFWKKQ
jgi:hypothetical protein